MHQIGDLVTVRSSDVFLDPDKKEKIVGVVTEKWVDEDDTYALIVDFAETPMVFRDPDLHMLEVV